MRIEAICAAKGLHREYLVRASHAEVMALGAVTFEADEVLTLDSAIQKLSSAMNQLRCATKGIEQLAKEPPC